MSVFTKKFKAAPAPGANGSTYPIPDPAKPSALLVPPFVLNRVAETRTRKRVVRVVVGVVTVAALAGAGAFGWAYTTKQDLQVATAQKQAADDRVAKYVEVARYYDGLTARKAALTAQLGGDIRYSKTTERLFAAAPGDVYPENVKYLPGAPCPGPDPFASEAALGCIEITGLAETPEAVGDYVDALNEPQSTNLIVGAFASRVSGGAKSDAAEFSVSVNYTAEALSYQFINPDEAAALTPTAPTSPTSPAQDGAAQ